MKNWFEKHIFNEAFEQRQAARKRLSGWMRAFLPFVFLSVSFGVAAVLILCAAILYQTFHPELPPLLSSGPLTLAQGLILFPSLLAGIAFSVEVSNLLLWHLPPIRKMLDQNVQGVSGASFKEGMRAGKRATIFVALPALILVFLGIWAPWAS